MHSDLHPHFVYNDLDDWRAFPANKQDKTCSHKTIDMGEFTPLVTNGVLAECVLVHTQRLVVIHLDQIDWPKDALVAAFFPKKKKEPTERKVRAPKQKIYGLDELA